MAKSFQELRATSDAELVRMHDQDSLNTIVGTQYYIDELRARENSKLAASMDRFTRKIFWLTIVMALATLVQLGLALQIIATN